MKIIVCVKQVPGTNEVRMDPVTNTIIREGVESIINPFDTYAIEEALRIRERHGARLAALSMGIPAVVEMLKECVALGIDEAFLLSDRAFAGADTLATAYALSLGVKKAGGADLILCGKMATDGDTAQVGPGLAEMLGIAHVTDVSEIMGIEDGAVTVRKMTDDGYMSVKVKLPAVVTVVKEINVPRLPSISGMLKGRDADIPVWTAQDVGADKERTGLSGSPTQVVKTFVPAQDGTCEFIEGAPAEQVASVIDILVGGKLLSR